MMYGIHDVTEHVVNVHNIGKSGTNLSLYYTTHASFI